jgi:hypothetical protein
LENKSKTAEAAKIAKTAKFIYHLLITVIVIVLSVGIFSLFMNYPVSVLSVLILLLSYGIWSNHKEAQYKRERISNNPIYAESSVTNVEQVEISGDFLISHTFEYKAVLYTEVTLVQSKMMFESMSVGGTIPIIFSETDPNEILIDYQVLAHRD